MPLVLVLALLLVPAASWAQTRTAIVNVTLVDVVEKRSVPGTTVVFDGDRIVDVAPTSGSQLPRGTKTIDGTGMFLIPGLWDMHTHFTHDQSTLDLNIVHGVTTLRDMGSLAGRRDGDKWESLPREEAIRAVLSVRDEIASGKREGPTIHSVGMIVTGGKVAIASPHQIVVETPEQARQAVNMLADLHVDAIKVHARLTRDTFDAIVSEAKKRKLPVYGHTPVALDPVVVSNAGQKTIEHMTGVWEYAHKDVPKENEERAQQRYDQEFATFRKNGTAIVPTLVSYLAGAEAYAYIQKPESNPYLDHVTPELALRWKADWPKSQFDSTQSKDFYESVKTLQQMTKDAHDKGVVILAGTDIGGIFTYPGLDLHRELKLFVEAGLSPMDALRSATILPAETMGSSKTSGSVSRGTIADLVLLAADPLQDIANADRIETVVVRGRVIDRKQLDQVRKVVAERAKPTLDILQRVPWLEE
jgi:imidazolonepropionase-like amidohydrolase